MCWDNRDNRGTPLCASKEVSVFQIPERVFLFARRWPALDIHYICTALSTNMRLPRLPGDAVVLAVMGRSQLAELLTKLSVQDISYTTCGCGTWSPILPK